MTGDRRRRRHTAALLLASLALSAGFTEAVAAPSDRPPPSGPIVPPSASLLPAGGSETVVINLIRLLVQEGVLTQDKANALIRQAQDEAAMAARGQKPPAAVAATTGPSGQPPVSVRVPYIPEIVRKQIRDEVKQEVMQQAKADHWAAPDALPEWTKRIHPTGDLRVRYEWDLFDPRNAKTFDNYAALNTTIFDRATIDAGTGFPPVLNTTADRERMRLRARLGFTADIADEITAGVQLATGNTTTPVSTNQTLGTTLNKSNFLLDRAYLQYQNRWLTAWVGRMANPWFYTDLVWSTELNFDGIAATFAPPRDGNIKPFLTAGAFPIENTSFNFPDNALDKSPSRDKWLYGAQLGLEWQMARDQTLKLGVAFYDFENISGMPSAPCNVQTSATICSTDNTRPAFLQQGNTLFGLRNITSATLFDFYGLAAAFRELNATLRYDYVASDPIHLILDGDAVTNLGFNAKSVAALKPVNNVGASPDGGNTVGPFAGGANGFQARLTLGHPQIHERWDWNVSAAYKYLETDAVVDAFTDSDFHLGGTNAKGYVFGGNLGVAHNVYFSARWLSASEISGAPYTVDVVQVDLNARF